MYTYAVSAIDTLGFPSGHCRKHTVVPDLQIHSQTGHNLPQTWLCDLWTPPDVSDPIQTRFVCPAQEGVTKKTEDTQYQLYKTNYLVFIKNHRNKLGKPSVGWPKTGVWSADKKWFRDVPTCPPVS